MDSNVEESKTMYPSKVAVSGAVVLPFTGMLHLGWAVIAGVTLVTVGAAALQLAPKRR